MKSEYKSLGIFLVICLGAMALGGLITKPAILDWYSTLNRPIFSPPNWVFGPIWTLLFILMAVAGWKIWSLGVKHKLVKIGLSLFTAQLVLNVGWSYLYFYQQNISVAFIEIMILWATILAMLLVFYRLEPRAGLMIIPYLAWVSFAAVLNGAFWALNP
jgi:translocator protein